MWEPFSFLRKGTVYKDNNLKSEKSCPYVTVCLSFSVLEYDTETKEVTVLMENLRFANGIQLFPDEESVLVAETTMARIRRYCRLDPPEEHNQPYLTTAPSDEMLPKGD